MPVKHDPRTGKFMGGSGKPSKKGVAMGGGIGRPTKSPVGKGLMAVRVPGSKKDGYPAKMYSAVRTPSGLMVKPDSFTNRADWRRIG